MELFLSANDALDERSARHWVYRKQGDLLYAIITGKEQNKYLKLTYRFHMADMVDEIPFSQIHCDLKKMTKHKDTKSIRFVAKQKVGVNMQ